jgi:PadR family transcriptional regulator PadR
MSALGARVTVHDAACRRALLEPCVLLLLGEGGGYGYDMVRRLGALGLGVDELGPVYHTLKRLEAEGLVTSTWKGSKGPARRIYELTADGTTALEAWSRRMEEYRGLLSAYRELWVSLEVSAG